MNNEDIKFWVSSCVKKKRYANEQQANEIINRVHKKRNTELRVYFCKKCLGYHLTHIKYNDYEERKLQYEKEM